VGLAIDASGAWRDPPAVEWRDRIRVPFSPETAASAIGHTGLYRACWYRRRAVVDTLAPGERLLQRFGTVDYSASVWVNGAGVGGHQGRYTPFSFDITRVMGRSGECEMVVRADDDPHDLAKPRGKQDWQLERQSIWYPRTTGIWQTVSLEAVPATALTRVTPHLARWEMRVGASIDGESREPLRLPVTLTSRGLPLAADTYTSSQATCTARFYFPIPPSTTRATSSSGAPMPRT
jgi:hypothetical protein